MSALLRGLMLLLNFTGVPRLVMRLMTDRRVPLGVKSILPATIIYLISPIDLIPENILPLFGRIDDAIVLFLGLALFLGLSPRDVVLEHLRNRGAPSGVRGSDAQKSNEKVIDGEYRVVDEDEGKEPRK